MNSFILLMLLLLLCSVALTWKPGKSYGGSINLAVHDKSLAPSKQSLLFKVGGGLAKYSTKTTVWLVTGLAWATLAFNVINTIIAPNFRKTETFNWDAVMSDPTFKNNVEQAMKMNEKKKLEELYFKSNRNLVGKSREILSKYWYLLLAVIIFITVLTIFYAKAENGDSSRATLDYHQQEQQQQIHVFRVNQKKLAALKIINSPKRSRRKRRKTV